MMFVAAGNAGAKNRFLVLLYLTCVVLSLAPPVVGPPERKFTQGQPELQQAMDNMIVRNQFMKRTLRLPSADSKRIPASLTDRTTHLLEEAERMLTPAKDLKEKEWMEGFIHKLQQLASVLEQNASNQTSENESNSFPVQDTAQSLNSSTVVKGHPLPHNPSDLISTAVPESGPRQQQSDQMTSKLSVTLPEINQVKPVGDYTAQQQVVTKPGLALAETAREDDELVRELENLHKISSFDHFQQSVEAPETSSQSVEITPASLTENKEEAIELEKEKERIKERLANEVAELKRLGETEEEIVNALHIDGFKLVDSTNQQRENGKEVNKFEENIDSSIGHESVKRVLDVQEENLMSNVDPKYWNLPALHAAKAPRQIYMNNTFLGMHISLPHMSPRILRRQFHYGLQRSPAVRNHPFYQGGLRDTIQKLQVQNHHNFMLRNHMFGAPNALQQGRPIVLGPVEVNPNAVSQSNSRYPPDNPALSQYPNPNIKSVYMTYPSSQNSEQKDGVPNDQSKMTTFSTNSLPTEFSDEMKRQLRDGKVILLSDSVVRSNFTLESENDGKEKTEDSKKEK